MTIDREKLIHLLMEKTDMDKLEVESQLDELTTRIMDAAERGKALEIKGFGLFYFNESGNLRFDASDQLDKEINYKYSGMEPLELRPPRQSEAAPSTSSEKVEEEPQPPVEDTSAKPESETEAEAEDTDDLFGISRTLKGTHEDDTSDEVLEPFGKLFQDRSSDPTPIEETEAKKAGTSPWKKTGETQKSKKKRGPAKSTSDPMNMIIYIVLGIVAVVIGYLAISEYLDVPEPVETAQQQTIEVEEPPVTAEQDITEPVEPDAPEQVEPVEDPPEANSEPAAPTQITEQDRYGLYGEFTEGSGNVYTIFVHSLGSRSRAERTADEFRQDGYRVIVTERTVDGRLYFRVGLGQFPSVQSALDEASNLPSPFNNQNFIQRIQ